MKQKITTDQVFEYLSEITMTDFHTHLVNGKLSARGLHDIFLYHMGVSELFSAGCPSGSRLSQYPLWPDKEEAHFRIKEALPYLKYVTHTHISWGTRLILKDLYGIDEPITEKNWLRMDEIIRERSDDRAFQYEIKKKTNIDRACTELARREGTSDDAMFKYASEWVMVSRIQWGEFDTALYELERIWGKKPGSPSPIGEGSRKPVDRTIKTLSDVHEAVDYYINTLPYDEVISLATHISCEIDLRLVNDQEMETALKNRAFAGEKERDVYASYVHEAILNRLDEKADQIIYQFSYAAEPLKYETGSRITQKCMAQVAEMISRHPKIQFQCMMASLHGNQTMTSFAREIPNLTMVGIWWHNFYPATLRIVLEQRLDMLPTNRQIGFFSDAYVLEWSYAKAYLFRKHMAEILANKINIGQYNLQDALDVFKAITYDTPNNCFDR